MKNLHLICNAHLDPVWQWEYDEGVGAVLSTFRAAADFCDEFDGFVFNHNESLIYEWVENNDPVLFQRIQRLVKEKKWHIMGAWYLQPDCNMPSGESLIRQIEVGKQYFADKFHVSSCVAINFDPFGHSKGLVQILEKSGYKGYICCRPYDHEMHTPTRELIWKGFNSSQIMVHRSDSYNQGMGRVGEKIRTYLENYQDVLETGLVLWGVGNHGGGPSRLDLKQISDLQREQPTLSILHSTPELYFDELEQSQNALYAWDQDLNPTMPGCYTSQARIKQTHRKLENELYLTEKMCTHAALISEMKYPDKILKEAQSKLLFAEFHDILPGSAIPEVEEQGLEIMHHGLNLLRELKAQAFFALSRHQAKAENGTYPVLIYNPHPFEITDVFETEFMLADQNYDTDAFDFPQVYHNGTPLPSQPIKERSNVPIQWRKRVAFHATLQPFSMNRFDVQIQKASFPQPYRSTEKDIYLSNKNTFIKISGKTGLIDSYMVNGVEYAAKNFAALWVFQDNEDPWGMIDNLYSKNPLGSFQLVTSPQKIAAITAEKSEKISAIRIVESGEVLMTAEAVFEYESTVAIVQYNLNKFDSTFTIRVRIFNNLKDRIIKLLFPLGFKAENYCGKTVFGVQELDKTGKETVSQEYVVAYNTDQALSIIKNGCYGSHFKNNTIGLSLLRGAAYCAHPIGNRTTLPSNRFVQRMDQGERVFEFTLNASNTRARLQMIEQESGKVQQKPQIISCFPNGNEHSQAPLLTIDNPCVAISALKQSADGTGYILRLFNSSQNMEKYRLRSPVLKIDHSEFLQSMEIRTLFLAQKTCTKTEIIDLAESERNDT